MDGQRGFNAFGNPQCVSGTIEPNSAPFGATLHDGTHELPHRRHGGFLAGPREVGAVQIDRAPVGVIDASHQARMDRPGFGLIVREVAELGMVSQHRGNLVGREGEPPLRQVAHDRVAGVQRVRRVPGAL